MAIGLICYGIALPASQAKSKPIDFASEVLPIFKAHCSPCHTNNQPAANLSLASASAARKSITPRDPATSVLLQRILGQGGLPQMPLGFKALSAHDANTIRQWISEGGLPSAGTARKPHWAFIPPVRPSLPIVQNRQWIQNPIDAFILQKLESRRALPSPKADRTTLIRRVTLDLIGLPPTVKEIDAFLADQSPKAYEKVVDRLLANPHYGERMAWPWLELARYADSNGFQQDGDNYQYVWRDWVVRALNENMPFDQFTIEQLAGDLLPKATVDQIVATAFNRNHMLNGEGGAIPEEQRYVNLFDRVDTTATAWLGLTMTCTRCHDHKYDPLTQRDYYSMLAFFNNVPETGVPSGGGQYRIADPWIYAGPPAETAKLARLRSAEMLAAKKVRDFRNTPVFRKSLEQAVTQAREFLLNAEGAKVEFSPWSEVGTFVGESFDAAYESRFGPEDILPSMGKSHPEWLDGTVIPLSGDRTAFYFARTMRSDRNCVYLFSIGSDDAVRAWLNGKEIVARKVTRAAVPDSELLIVNLTKGVNSLVLKIVNGAGIGGFYFKAYPGGMKTEIANFLRANDPDSAGKLNDFFGPSLPLPEYQTLLVAARRASDEVTQFTMSMPRVMVMSDAQPRRSYILHRGNYTEHLEEVKPGTPKSLPGLSQGAKNRLDLAKWILSPRNPLAARFQVNRAWQLFFGRGLVRTEENFGVKGEPPTHPELLDWLAVEFRESGWNVKRLHKLIVMSATYQQSSRVSQKMLRDDPANQFYGRAPRFRLASSILRDVALSSSGLLNPKLGGKPVYPYQPKGIWDGLAITLERDFTYPQSKGDDNHRRSLYTFWRRTVAPGNMFDASTRQVCIVRPSLTSSPLHALTMLNDITWVEAGRALAEQVLPLPTDKRLEAAFRRVCARRPRPDELAILDRSLRRARSVFKLNPAAAKEFVSLGDHKSDSRLDVVELAAYASICQAIFNLDEAMTKE